MHMLKKSLIFFGPIPEGDESWKVGVEAQLLGTFPVSMAQIRTVLQTMEMFPHSNSYMVWWRESSRNLLIEVYDDPITIMSSCPFHAKISTGGTYG